MHTIEKNEKETEAGAKQTTKKGKSWNIASGCSNEDTKNHNKNQNKDTQLLIKRGAKLDEPETVKKVIAEQSTWNEGSKSFAVVAYSSYLNKEGTL